MITLVKFMKNRQEDAPPNNKVISKTLGKTGVLSWEHINGQDEVPQAEEFWYVEIVKEKGSGTSRGVFMLRPIQKVPEKAKDGEPDIIHMIPGTYTTERQENTILLHPKILNYPEGLGPNWICSLTMRRKIMSKYKENGQYTVNSIIVVFDGATDWPREELPGKSAHDAGRSSLDMAPG
jgi:hypothetical protein